MRIVGGKFKGHSIAPPHGSATRPTTDRVRESVFNILAHGIEGLEIQGARVLDLFAGTGAMGLEAVSRGARFCQFVEDSAEARGLIRKNADALGVIGLVKIWRRDATSLGPCAPQPGFERLILPPAILPVHQQRHPLLKTQLTRLITVGQFPPGLRHPMQPHGFQLLHRRLM